MSSVSMTMLVFMHLQFSFNDEFGYGNRGHHYKLRLHDFSSLAVRR